MAEVVKQVTFEREDKPVATKKDLAKVVLDKTRKEQVHTLRRNQCSRVFSITRSPWIRVLKQWILLLPPSGTLYVTMRPQCPMNLLTIGRQSLQQSPLRASGEIWKYAP